MLICVVDDNGIRRQASQANKAAPHASMGLNISAQRIALRQNEAGIGAGVSISDKTADKEGTTGTTVLIVLPLLSSHAYLCTY